MAENGTFLSSELGHPNDVVEDMETDADDLLNVPLPDEDFKIGEKTTIEPLEIAAEPIVIESIESVVVVEQPPEIEVSQEKNDNIQDDIKPAEVFSEDAIQSLYASFGYDDKQSKKSISSKIPRLDTIHIKGVDNMDTDDVISYFKDFSPLSVEWINDFSCNVVWTEPEPAAQALLNLSRPISRQTPHKDHIDTEKAETKVEDAEEEGELPSDTPDALKPDKVDVPGDEISFLDVGVPVPPGTWRLGNPDAKSRALLMRFAFKSDRKLPGAEKRSNFYQKHGNPNFGGMKGIISKSLKNKLHHRKPYSNRNKSTHDDEDGESGDYKEPTRKFRMRMYADDEEIKLKRIRTNARMMNLEVEDQPIIPSLDDADYAVGSVTDLRTKIRYPVSKVDSAAATRSSGSDLRNKLDKIRKSKASDQHHPLLIQVTRDEDEDDTGVRW